MDGYEGTDLWKAFYERASDEQRTTVRRLLDHAVAKLARLPRELDRHGFDLEGRVEMAERIDGALDRVRVLAPGLVPPEGLRVTEGDVGG